MNETSSSLIASQVQQADEDRTKRAFIGFLGSYLGIDQTYTNADGSVNNAAGQFMIANPDGSYSQVGQSRSNLNSVAVNGFQITPQLILLGLAAFFVFKKLG